MVVAADIYTSIRDSLFVVVPKVGWTKALLRVEWTAGAQNYSGIVLAEEKQIFFDLLSNSLNDLTVFDLIEKLHLATIQGGNNEWNLLYFSLTPNGAFEVDFVLDEDAVTARDYIRRTEQVPDARRREGYRALQRQLSQARSAHLYCSISQRLPALAAVMQPTWGQLTLHIEQWRGGFFKLKGIVQANNPEEADEFNVTQDWSLVKEFYELSRMEYLPDWHLATWTLKPDGTYAILFDWDLKRDPRIPPNTTFPYTHEGRWQDPA